MTHTPGPWRISEMRRPPIGFGPHEVGADGNIFWGYSISGSNEHGGYILPTLAAVHNFPDNIAANARLIAAAPDMLQALKLFVAYDAADDDDGVKMMLAYADALEAAKAAIAKATTP